jgi:hypothetical protein
MATSKYILSIESKGSNARFLLSYRSGNFFRVERISGKLKHNKQWQNLMLLIPEKESAIAVFSLKFKPKGVLYERPIKEAKNTLYTHFMDEYFSFYESQCDVKPRINAISGKALKNIITHLQSICADDNEALTTWKVLLSNWDKVEEFYSKQMELRQINSNINILIRQIKDGGNSKETNTAQRNADDIRRSI